MANLNLAAGGDHITMTKKGRFFDYNLLIIVLFLLAFGLVMVYSTSSYSGVVDAGDSAFYFKKQLFSTAIGLVCMVFAVFVNYHVWYRFAGAIYILGILSIFMVLTPLGMTLNGARRWINVFGVTSLQPAEILKLALIISLAAFVCYSGSKMKALKNNLIYIVLSCFAAAVLLIVTRNLSTAIIVMGIAYVILMIANPKPKWLIIVTVIGLLIVVGFLFYFFEHVTSDSDMSFRFMRLLVWRNPKAFAAGLGYQTLQALYALGSGGLFGKGLGHSIQKLGFIPEAQNDMIFSVVCEELGLFGGICLIILFLLMIWRFMVIANNAPDLYGSLLVVGVMAHISIQVILNIGVVTNVIPNTGITLPFISYGGTSVMFLLIEMGLVLNVSRHIQVPVAK